MCIRDRVYLLTNISQGSVATRLNVMDYFSDIFITNFVPIVENRQEYGGLFSHQRDDL